MPNNKSNKNKDKKKKERSNQGKSLGKPNLKLQRKEVGEVKNKKDTDQEKYMVAMRQPVYATSKQHAVKKFNKKEIDSLDFFEIGKLTDFERDEHISCINIDEETLRTLYQEDKKVIVETKIDGITRQIQLCPSSNSQK